MSLQLVTIALILSSCSCSGGTEPTLIAKPAVPGAESAPGPRLRQEKEQQVQPGASSGPQPVWSYNKLPDTHDDNTGQIFHDSKNQIIYFLSFRKNKSLANHSTLFVLRNTGETVKVVTLLFRNKTLYFDRLYFSGGVCIAYSKADSVAAVSSNGGWFWIMYKFSVFIKTFLINKALPKYIVAISEEQLMYVSSNTGITWSYYTSAVHAAVWSQYSQFLYYLKGGYSNSRAANIHLFRRHILYQTSPSYILMSVSEIGTVGNVLFAKRNLTKREILVSYKDGQFRRCVFPDKLNVSDLVVRAATEKELFIVARTWDNRILLYSGLLTDLKFVKISSDVGEFDSFFDVACVNLETFKELPGVVITNNGVRKGNGSGLGPHTVISFSHGSRWSHLVAPRLVNGKRCDWPRCRLLLHLECNNFMGSEVVEIAKRAPHLMVAHGIILNGTSKSAYGMYISDDAGLTWRMASTSFHEFAILNDGGVILTYPRFGHGTYFSFDFGLTWRSTTVTTDTFRVIRVLHDHTGTALAASAVGYDETTSDWVFIKADFSLVLGKDCQPSDYNSFTPGPGITSQCFQGARNFIYRRRHNVTCRSIIAKLPVLNTTKCPCRKEDFGCSFGRFLKDGTCVNDPDHMGTNQTCTLGQFVFSDSRYVKLNGDSCTATRRLSDEEVNVCRFTSTDDTLTLMDETTLKYANLDSQDALKFFDLPVKVLSPRSPGAFDIDHKMRCLYYLNGSGIVKSCWTTREEATSGSEAFVVKARGLLGVEFEHLGRNIYYYTKSKVSVVNVDSGYKKDVHKSTSEIIFVELFHSQRCMLIYSISSERGKLRHVVSKMSLAGAVLLTIEPPERIFAAALRYTGHIVLYSTKCVYQYKSDGSIFNQTAVVGWNVLHARFGREREVIVTSNHVRANNKSTFLPYIKDADIFFASDLANNPCSLSNCEYLCFPTGNHSYTCGCPTNMTADSAHGCVCDEEHPNCTGCANTEFHCATNKCMNKSVRCNGVDDCGDGSDEADCKYGCTNDEFQCNDGSLCVNVEAMCNGVNDCPDASDEVGCPTATTCSAAQFRCFNGACVPLNKQCNGINDCGDFSDEESCEASNCKQGEAKCKNGECILQIQVCNGVFDCHDWSDEQGCDTTEEDEEGDAGCSPKCAEKCISASQVCDHYLDCPSGEDEMGCNHSSSCPANGYANCFSTAECYKTKQACNGFAECSDSSDEFDCPEFDKCKLPEKFICSSDRSCINPNQYCDGKPDCSDKSDEASNCGDESIVTKLKVGPTSGGFALVSWELRVSDRGKPVNVTLVPRDATMMKRKFTTNGTEAWLQDLEECGAYTVVVKLLGAVNGRSLQFVSRPSNPEVPKAVSYDSLEGVLSWRRSAYPCQPPQYHVLCSSGGRTIDRYFVGENRILVKYRPSLECMVSSCPSPIFNLSCSEFSRPVRLVSGRAKFDVILSSTLAAIGVIGLAVLLFKQKSEISCDAIKRLFARRGAVLDISGSAIIEGREILRGYEDEEEMDM